MAGLLHRLEADDGAELVHWLTGTRVELWLETHASMWACSNQTCLESSGVFSFWYWLV